MAKLFVQRNAKAPETGSLFIRFKDGEMGYLRFIPKCETSLIEQDGLITRKRRECKLTLFS